MAKRPLPLPEVYRLIEPGPVVLVSRARCGQVQEIWVDGIGGVLRARAAH